MTRSIVLTGATGGLGQALVRAYARPGTRFLLLGRDADRLAGVTGIARARGADATALAADIRDVAAFAEAVEAFGADHGIDLLILNAGVKTGNDGGVEPAGETDRILSVNLAAPMAQVQKALPILTARKAGRIVLMSSLASESPQPDLLSYSASKAGLAAYGTALRRSLRGAGIGVTVVLPGFVDTPMTDRHDGPTPFKISADDAAEIIRARLSAGASRIAFPRRLAALLWLQSLLPAGLSDRIDARFRATILPDRDEAGN